MGRDSGGRDLAVHPQRPAASATAESARAAMAALVEIATVTAAPAPPAAPAQLEAADVEPVAGGGWLAESSHGGPPAGPVALAHPDGQVTELVDQRRHELVRVTVEQAGVELERAPGAVSATERGAQPGVPFDREPRLEAPTCPETREQPARQARQGGEVPARRGAPRRSPGPGRVERQLELHRQGQERSASASTRSRVLPSIRPVCRKTIRPWRSSTTRVGRPTTSSAASTRLAGSSRTG